MVELQLALVFRQVSRQVSQADNLRGDLLGNHQVSRRFNRVDSRLRSHLGSLLFSHPCGLLVNPRHNQLDSPRSSPLRVPACRQGNHLVHLHLNLVDSQQASQVCSLPRSHPGNLLDNLPRSLRCSRVVSLLDNRADSLQASLQCGRAVSQQASQVCSLPRSHPGNLLVNHPPPRAVSPQPGPLVSHRCQQVCPLDSLLVSLPRSRLHSLQAYLVGNHQVNPVHCPHRYRLHLHLLRQKLQRRPWCTSAQPLLQSSSCP